jgi:UDP:flavonoid glycosyltransferase YjiC (YdhE family)
MSDRFIVAAFGDPGHALPAITLARALRRRGNEVLVESWDRWREMVEADGIEFRAAEEYSVYPPPGPGGEAGGTAARAARALIGLMEEYRPDVVVNDILTLAPALAAEATGIPRATLIPHVFAEQQPGMPLFSIGMRPPRTPIGRLAWKATMPLIGFGLRRGRDDLNGIRSQLDLPPLERFHGGTSESLALVATFPQLEYPRRWRDSVRITGPLLSDIEKPEVQLPPGEAPLVLVAPSTSQDPDCELLRAALEGLDGAPVRVLATLNGHKPPRPLPSPDNARVYDWISYRQAMGAADLVVCHGGHGTVVRALSEGVPVLVSPAGGDMGENGARVSWAGCGQMLPRRLLGPRNLRLAAAAVLDDPVTRERASEIAAWGRNHDGPEIAAELLEALAAGEQVTKTSP